MSPDNSREHPELKQDAPTDSPAHIENGNQTPTQPAGSDTDRNKPTKILLHWIRKLGKKWKFSIAAATLLVNSVIAWIYLGQLREMQKATKATQDAIRISSDTLQATVDNFQLDQRAWVSISNVDVGFEIGKPLTFTVHQLNTGKTPARDIAAHAAGEPVSRGSSPKFDLARMEGEAGYIAPNREYLGTVNLTKTLPTGLTQKDMDEIIRGDWTPYVRGIIRYKDIWNNSHQTIYCYFIEVKDQMHWNLAACPHVPGQSNPNEGD